jgi:signal transduction histidine kinase
VHVEEVSVGGRVLADTRDLRIPARPDRVEIRYTATGLRMPEHVRIEYRLDGADRDWQIGGPLRAATYTQLDPGRYTFRVRAWNEDGVGSTRDAVLHFRVEPAWNQTAWFVALVVLSVMGVAAGGAYGAHRIRSRQSAERMRAGFEAALGERTRLARELHDTLLQGFTGITLQLQAIHRTVADVSPAAAVTLERVLGLADNTLREARQMVWDMRPTELIDQDLPAAIADAVKAAAAGTPIVPRVQVTGIKRRLPPAQEVALLRIAREAVSNALKHAAAAAVDVELIYEAGSVRLAVRDDGRGLSPDQAVGDCS